jgi:hypothetical protein
MEIDKEKYPKLSKLEKTGFIVHSMGIFHWLTRVGSEAQLTSKVSSLGELENMVDEVVGNTNVSDITF